MMTYYVADDTSLHTRTKHNDFLHQIFLGSQEKEIKKQNKKHKLFVLM